MKSGLEMVSDVALLLDTPEVRAVISGDIWQHHRPGNASTVDIVVNIIAATNQQLQQGVVNVNVHAPNLKHIINGREESTLPDLATMLRVGKVVTGILDANWQHDFHTDIDEPGEPLQDAGAWYLNIRVNYYSFQENYQNI